MYIFTSIGRHETDIFIEINERSCVRYVHDLSSQMYKMLLEHGVVISIIRNNTKEGS